GLTRSVVLPLFRPCRAGRSSTASSACVPGPDPYEGRDRAALVHGSIRAGDAVQVRLVIKDAPGLDTVPQDVVEQLRDVPAHRCGAAAQPDIPGEHRADRDLNIMGNADETDSRAGASDGECRRKGLGRPDTFEGGVNADAVRQLPDRAGRRVVALGNDVCGSKLAGQ